MQDVCISGHPIVFTEYPKTLLFLVHHSWRKPKGSVYWAVQLRFDLDTDTFVITAVSKRPVLDQDTFVLHSQDNMTPLIAVGSYHVEQDFLRILFGDEEKHAAFEDVCLSSIAWTHLDETFDEPWTDALAFELGNKLQIVAHAA